MNFRLTQKVVSEYAKELGLRLVYEMRGGYSVALDRGYGYTVTHYGGSLREAMAYLHGVADGREGVEKRHPASDGVHIESVEVLTAEG